MSSRIAPIYGTDLPDVIDESSAIGGVIINSRGGDDEVIGSDFADRLYLGSGDDIVEGGEGDDTIVAGSGEDTARYRGSIFDYDWSEARPGILSVTDTNTSDGDEGTDTLRGVEILQFDDFVFNMGGNNAALVHVSDQSTDEDSPLSFSFQAWDFDGGDLTIQSITGSSGGSFTVDGYTPISSGMGVGKEFMLSFDPGSDYQHLGVGDSVVENVEVVVSDGQGSLTTETIQVTIEGLNDAPVANDDAVGGPSTGRVLFVSDSGAGEAMADVLEADGHQVDRAIDDFVGGSNPALLGDLSSYDTIVWSASGNIYGDRHTDPAVFQNLEAFAQGGGRVFVTGYDSIASPEDPLLISFLGGTSSSDFGFPTTPATSGNSLTEGVVDISGLQPTGYFGDTDTIYPAPGTQVVVESSYTGGASWTLRPLGDGEIAYVSNGQIDTSSSHASWTNTSSGSDGAYNAALRNFAFNSAQANGAIDEDGSRVISQDDLLANDTDIDNDDLTITSVSATSDLGAAVSLNGDITYDTNGAFDHLSAGETAIDYFDYTVDDGNGGTDTARVAVEIRGVNDDPVVSGVTYNQSSVQEDGNLVATGSVDATDIDQSDVLAYSVQGGGTGTYGSLTIDANGDWTYNLDNNAASVQALNSGDTVQDTFTVEVDDQNGGVVEQVVSVDVQGENDAALLTFNNLFSSNHYQEDGFEFYSLDDHIHWSSGVDPRIENHSGCCTTPIRLERVDGATFDLLSLDLEYTNGLVEFTGSNGATVSRTASGHVDFGSTFDDVTWVDWHQVGGGSSFIDSGIDNVLVA